MKNVCPKPGKFSGGSIFKMKTWIGQINVLERIPYGATEKSK